MTVVASNYARKENDLYALVALFDYDAVSGDLRWRARPAEAFELGAFSASRKAASWNSKNAGKVAGWVGADGYRRVTVGPKSYLAHRIVWLIVTGEWPSDQVDHIDQDRLNNRFANLRAATNAQNARNRTLPSNNTSGAIGVSQCRTTGKWRAEIKVHGRKRFLGVFADKAEAMSARLTAQAALGFSVTHGRPT